MHDKYKSLCLSLTLLHVTCFLNLFTFKKGNSQCSFCTFLLCFWEETYIFSFRTSLNIQKNTFRICLYKHLAKMRKGRRIRDGFTDYTEQIVCNQGLLCCLLQGGVGGQGHYKFQLQNSSSAREEHNISIMLSTFEEDLT